MEQAPKSLYGHSRESNGGFNGPILTVAGRRCFVGLSIDPSKKQNKADRQLLVATARAAVEFFEYGAGT
jgi:hypothetical protein